MLNIDWNNFLTLSIDWLLTSGLRIILYIIGGILVTKTVKKIGKDIIKRFEDDDTTTRNDEERRADTLVSVVNVTTKVFIWVIVAFMILREVGANITPLLTGAGVAGIAIGFGAQNIVRDFFNGFLILLENQFRIGDVVTIAGRSGAVKEINLRTTVLRDLQGVMHVIPNGEIKAVDNMTFTESRAVVDVGISYDSSIDGAIEVLGKIGDELKADGELGRFIRVFDILGVNNLGDSSVDIRVMITTEPSQQWAIGRKFKYLVKTRFDEAGIEIPYPHQTIYIRKETGE